MKYLKNFESYEQTTNEYEYLDMKKKTLEQISKLSNSQKLKLKSELEKFASENGLTFDDLKNQEIVNKVLTMKLKNEPEKDINEGISSWLGKNFGGLMRLISKYSMILSVISFVLGLGIFYTTGIDTMPVIKASTAAFIISNAAGALSGLG